MERCLSEHPRGLLGMRMPRYMWLGPPGRRGEALSDGSRQGPRARGRGGYRDYKAGLLSSGFTSGRGAGGVRASLLRGVRPGSRSEALR